MRLGVGKNGNKNGYPRMLSGGAELAISANTRLRDNGTESANIPVGNRYKPQTLDVTGRQNSFSRILPVCRSGLSDTPMVLSDRTLQWTLSSQLS